MAIIGHPGATSFSLAQLRTFAVWGVSQSHCFAIRVTTDHQYYPELAELYTHDSWMSPLWFLHATLTGTVVITKPSGAEQELGTVEEALARVVELERPTPNALCPTRARAQQGWHCSLRSTGP